MDGDLGGTQGMDSDYRRPERLQRVVYLANQVQQLQQEIRLRG